MCIVDFVGMKQYIENGRYDNKLRFPRMDETTKEGYITDENKSVKWNKEQVNKNMEFVKIGQMEYHTEETKLYNLFKSDMIDILKNFYNFTEEQGEVLFEKAWEEGHSDGYSAVLDVAQELTELIEQFLKAGK